MAVHGHTAIDPFPSPDLGLPGPPGANEAARTCLTGGFSAFTEGHCFPLSSVQLEIIRLASGKRPMPPKSKKCAMHRSGKANSLDFTGKYLAATCCYSISPVADRQLYDLTSCIFYTVDVRGRGKLLSPSHGSVHLMLAWS